jgi:alkanesulfonate monooxygenase SsuD/methylene tetrahydromethanopterin reductase-like flavin-dependent oxidoreductase (luciferase family)
MLSRNHFKEVASMSKSITFGIMLVPTPPWKQLIEQARLVESLGFDKLWLPDHFVNPGDKEMEWFDCWSVISALSTQTDQITLGTMVASMTLRNPAFLARMALTVDHISNGRLELGVGAGGAPGCHKMTGVPHWEPRERSERFKEFVEILDHMLEDEITNYKGKYYKIQDALIRPSFISKPRPVFSIAAHGPKSIRLAATYGDAWNCYNPGKDLTPKQSSDAVRHRYEMLCEFALEAQREPEQIGTTFGFGYTSDGLFRSMEAFYDAIGRYHEAGIYDFFFIYAYGIDGWKEQTITTENLLHKIALEAIPKARDKM